MFNDPGFRGCAFERTSAEAPEGTSIVEVSAVQRLWLRALLMDLVKAAEARNPEQLAGPLLLLYDGAAIPAWMDDNPGAVTAARAVATALVQAAIAVTDEPAAQNRMLAEDGRSEFRLDETVLRH